MHQEIDSPAARLAAGRQARAGLAVRHYGGAWLALGHQAGSDPVAGRIVLVLIAVLAVGAFTMLQVKARSRERSSPQRRPRPVDAPDRRTVPPAWYGADTASSGDDERYRPDRGYGYLPRRDSRGRAR